MRDWPTLRAQNYVERAREAARLSALAALPGATKAQFADAERAAANLRSARTRLEALDEPIPVIAEETSPAVQVVTLPPRQETAPVPAAAIDPEGKRVAKLTVLARGFQSSAEDLATAIADGTTPTSFALAQSDKAVAARDLEAIVAGVTSYLPANRRGMAQISAEEAHAREVDAVAARISGDETLIAEGISRRAEAAPSPADSAAAVAARICAA